MSFPKIGASGAKVEKRRRFPTNPKKGTTKTVKMKGRSVTFKATGKKGFGAWKILGAQSSKFGKAKSFKVFKK